MTEIRLIDNNGVRCAILETKNYQVYAPVIETLTSSLGDYIKPQKRCIIIDGDYVMDNLLNEIPKEEISDAYLVEMFWDMYTYYCCHVEDILNISEQ